MKKIWKLIDAWRGVYEPIPPEGWEFLISCSVVNEAGNQLRAILTQWLKGKKIKYRSGYMRTSNVFSGNLYVIVEKGKLNEDQKKEIENWFVHQNNGTFSIFSGGSWPLNIGEALKEFTSIVVN